MSTMASLRAWVMRVFGVFGSTAAERELSAEIDRLESHAAHESAAWVDTLPLQGGSTQFVAAAPCGFDG